MGLRRELLLTLGMLLGLNLLLSFGAIGLFGRMSPAIQRVLTENVFSIAAAQEILAELALMPEQAGADAKARVDDAIERIERNVTETAERPLIGAIEREIDAALDGDRAARERVIASLLELITVNRKAMDGTNESARRLGAAGAWGAVFIGFISFGLSVLIAMRFRVRLLEPMVELHRVLEDTRRGEPLRRCRRRDAPFEVQHIADAVNRLLDERLERRTDTQPVDNPEPAATKVP